MPSWRDVSLEFVEAGRCLKEIEDAIRHVAATAAIKDEGAKDAVQRAYSAALRLSRELDKIRRML